MQKLLKQTILCFSLAVFAWCGTLLADRMALNDKVIRFHVVANSDEAEDQSIKLKVRDAVIASIQKDLQGVADMDTAKQYLQENLPRIEAIANETLEAAGVDCRAVVSLCREAFDTRTYDTFTMPAGVYEALRIVIGEGNGKNWWCVVFPSLCLPAASEDFDDVAAGAGFSASLSGAMTGEAGCELRFFLLDALGELENNLFAG